MDPLADIEKHLNVSPYAYVSNNPIIYVDPTGMSDSTANSGNNKSEYKPEGKPASYYNNPLNAFRISEILGALGIKTDNTQESFKINITEEVPTKKLDSGLEDGTIVEKEGDQADNAPKGNGTVFQENSLIGVEEPTDLSRAERIWDLTLGRIVNIKGIEYTIDRPDIVIGQRDDTIKVDRVKPGGGYIRMREPSKDEKDSIQNHNLPLKKTNLKIRYQ